MTEKQHEPTASPFWDRSVHADRRPFLIARTRTFASWRRWFEGLDFLEVDTAALQVSPGNEAHIAGFATEEYFPSGEKRPFYLHSSPEFACKKLLAAGETKIFSLSHVFRNGERGRLHQPEFTMLEWYRTGAPYDSLIADCEALAKIAAQAAGAAQLTWRGASCDPFLPPERLSVLDAFARYAGIDLEAALDGGRAAFAGAALAAGLRVTADDAWSDIFSKIVSERIEPHLGHGRLTVLDRYPACEAALAQLCPDDARFAERFELYACGVELANAFGELTDPDEQRRRFEAEMAERARLYGEAYPLDEDFLAALPHMPPASGIALGADRLIALATGAPSIEHVMWTPVAR
ncbi:MAG: EF-P lysine aminoacylase EpmA [Beijerinckiaceae bacterium]